MNYFDLKASYYDDYISIEKYAANILFDAIEDKFYEKSLEIGTGTGLFTQKLLTRSRDIHSLDTSSKMLNIAKEKLKDFAGLYFYKLDADKIHELDESFFDLVTSASTINWLTYPDIFIKKVFHMLKKTGTIAFTAFGPKTYQELYKVLNKLNIKIDNDIFKPVDYWETALSNAGFKNIKSEVKNIVSFVPSAQNLLKMISKTGAGLNKTSGEKLSISELKLLMYMYDKKYMSQLGIRVNYQIILMMAKK